MLTYILEMKAGATRTNAQVIIELIAFTENILRL